MPGADESVKFTAPAKGRYRIRIGDAKAQGGQAYVYRLTLTSENVPEFIFPLRTPADGLKDVQDITAPHAAPVALNGRIATIGAVQEWKIELKKAVRYTFELQARRFDSPLAGVVAISDASGKELAKVVHKFAEDGKIAVRHARTHARDQLKKVSGVSEDDIKHAEKDLQKIHDDYIHKIDDLIKAKEAEIMEV